MKIEKTFAIETLDSRGNPTVKAYVELENGLTASAMVPSGASTGTHEAVELRDGNKEVYHGKSVNKAVQHVNTVISRALHGLDIEDLKKIDETLLELDGTDNKSNLGANAILATSLAAARTLSFHEGKPLWKTINDHYFPRRDVAFPRPMVNVINGGAHANWSLDFQEFMIIPTSLEPSKSIKASSEIFHSLKSLLKKDNHAISVGDEGGFAPMLESNDAAFEYIEKAISEAGYSRKSIDLGTDVAASEFYNDDTYNLVRENASWSSSELADFYKKIIKKYDVLSFEDPFHEDDWEAFVKFSQDAQNQMIVGDDLYVTNIKRIKQGIDKEATNAVLIKVNQIGSLLETVQAIQMTYDAGWKAVISHRSGETEDSFIADLAYGCGAQFIKTGSMSRSERLAKYNRLLEIEALEI